ncbi:glycine zipper domain-containing protein [Ruegeria atlantica]|uniref:glycine zipper domain-containing protein n=1 Tax=Ruegeria atlantica TaxID=81569 RepID=UPI0024959261|nr:glycine zipper domain-containing protein [Ruegeria atlantica]
MLLVLPLSAQADYVAEKAVRGAVAGAVVAEATGGDAAEGAAVGATVGAVAGAAQKNDFEDRHDDFNNHKEGKGHHKDH